MSYSIYAYAIDIDALKKVCGSKDKKLFDVIKKKYQRDLKDLDDYFEDTQMKGEEALKALIFGEKKKQSAAFLYGYALELICKYIGKPLMADYCTRYRSEFDDVLIKKKLTKKFNIHETVGDPGIVPVKIPPIDDYPMIGSLTVKQAKVALEALEGTNFDDIKAAIFEEYRGLDRKAALENMPNVINEVKNWLKNAIKYNGLICFNY